ncbi:hypothetical protein chiPu_0007305 [Chiloscyllium punctatum]|uniref:Uncharacterized protein n=1 Tax=Chiloscyllium punctatum TaxID=137246 RepID=A0A401SEQ9_CHIPU|nr:hypothetical protein [Chiloscyllium punctatum]
MQSRLGVRVTEDSTFALASPRRTSREGKKKPRSENEQVYSRESGRTAAAAAAAACQLVSAGLSLLVPPLGLGLGLGLVLGLGHRSVRVRLGPGSFAGLNQASLNISQHQALE